MNKWEELKRAYLDETVDIPKITCSMRCPVCKRCYNKVCVYYFGYPTNMVNFCPTCGDDRME